MKHDRRKCIKTMLALGAGAGAAAAWPGRLAANLKSAGGGRKLIILWMPGGPSQMDTWDLKPGHPNGGPFREQPTSVPGMRFSEHLPELAKLADHLCLIRSMQTKEGDHSRGTFLVRTGQRPGAPFGYPALPAAVGKELASADPSIPGYVSILPNSIINPAAFSAGFLGASREPLTVTGDGSAGRLPIDDDPSVASAESPVDLRVDNLLPPDDLDANRIQRRQQFWSLLQDSYGAARRGGPAATHDTVYRRALKLAESELVDAFDLSQESDAVRREYGSDAFGQGCLMARRLVERGVPVVEVALNDGPGGLAWDTHADNFSSVKRLSQRLDRSWSRLMRDLANSGLLEETTIAWMGEFGRTPEINEMGGRDHFPTAWSCVLAGAGIVGGSLVGQTSNDGREVVDRPVSAPEFLATICQAVGVHPATENINEDGRPIKIVDGEPIHQVLS